MRRPIYDLLLKGQDVLVKGNKDTYQIAKSLQKFVYKGHVQRTSTSVLLKFESDPLSYERELAAFEFDCINKSPYIRALHEAVDTDSDKCMVFEWMDHDLWTLRRKAGIRLPTSPLLPKVVAKSVLLALAELSYMDGQTQTVHADINPNNILVSDADTPSPTVKLADMGCLLPAEELGESRYQGLEIRAPEIWKKPFTTTASDVWSLGVSLVHYLAGKCIFGASDLNIAIDSRSHEVTQAAWCIAKITKIIGPIIRDEDPEYKDEFDVAEGLAQSPVINTMSLEEELSKLAVPEDCTRFIRHLLTIDPKERPTPEQALSHPWLRDV